MFFQWLRTKNNCFNTTKELSGENFISKSSYDKNSKYIDDGYGGVILGHDVILSSQSDNSFSPLKPN